LLSGSSTTKSAGWYGTAYKVLVYEALRGGSVWGLKRPYKQADTEQQGDDAADGLVSVMTCFSSVFTRYVCLVSCWVPRACSVWSMD
jgi:hypothetical protein